MGSFGWLGVSLFLWSTAYNMALPFLPLTAAALGAAPSQVGLVQGVAYAGAALALLPAGWLADRCSRRSALFGTWTIGAGGTLLMAVAGSWRAMLPGAFLMLAGAGAMPALAALAAEVAPVSGRRRAMNVVFAAAPGGLLVGSSVGGLMADTWGLRPLFVAAAGVTLLAMLPLLLVADRHVAERGLDGAGGGQGGPSGGHLARLMPVAVPAGFAYALLALPSGFLTPYLRDVVGLSLTGTGITNAQLAVGQLAWSGLFAVWPGELGRIQITFGPVRGLQFGRGTLLALSVCLGANAVFGFMFTAGGAALVVLAPLLRGALFSLQPLGMALVAEMTGTGTGLAGRLSLLALVVGAATAVAPIVAGLLYAVHPAWPFVVASLAAGLGLAALLVVRVMARPVA